MKNLDFQTRETFYQYCSAEAFKGIIQSKVLWYTDLAGANDPREIHLGYERFVEALCAVRKIDYKGSAGLFLDKFREDLSNARETQQPFCCCFSLAQDELPMWGTYGSNYSGLAIGFRTTAISSMPGRLQQVTYLDASTDASFKDLVRKIATEVKRDINDAMDWIYATVSALVAITSLKHNTWAYEREVRSVFIQRKTAPKEPSSRIPADFYDDGVKIFWTQPLQRRGLAGDVSYLKFPFGERENKATLHNRAIERIVRGPNCELTLDAIDGLLRENRYRDYEIVDSGCRIRVARS